MQNYTTIIGVIELRGRKCPYDVIQKRYSIGSSTLQLIMKRYAEIDIPLEDLKAMEPSKVEEMFYPPQNLRRDDIPMPDFQKYYERLMDKGSKVNMYFLWIEYKEEHPNGYQQTQFYEHFRRFIEKNYGGRDVSMPVERIPGEKMFIDWVGDQPELIVDTHTGEIHKIHIFTTTLGVSSMVFAEAFMDEKLPSFIQGTVDAIQFYGGVPKYLVPDNCKTAVTKHLKDELVLNTAYQDLEEFYDTIITPPPARKPKGKAAVEVAFLSTVHKEESGRILLEALKSGVPLPELQGIYQSGMLPIELREKILPLMQGRKAIPEKIGERMEFLTETVRELKESLSRQGSFIEDLKKSMEEKTEIFSVQEKEAESITEDMDDAYYLELEEQFRQANKTLVFKSSGYREMISEIKAKEEAEKRAEVRKTKEEHRRMRREKRRNAVSRIIKKSKRKNGKKRKEKSE